MSLRVAAKLAYWLGPFGGDDRAPTDFLEETLTLAPSDDYAAPIDVLTYAPRGRIDGAVLAVHGLHPAGPRDPRMQQFCRRLAGGGLRVWAPALPEYLQLKLDAGVIPALRRVARAMPSRFAAFSISFGSLPTLRLLESDAEKVQGIVLFGGYADFANTMRFALGAGGEDRDPLNPPVIFINLAAQIAGAPQDVAPVIAAWHAFAVATWGKPEMREHARYSAVADQLAAPLDAEQKELFYLGCGMREGMLEKAEAALQRVIARYQHLDPRPFIKGSPVPVTIVHGADDDVIPWQEADTLVAALPNAQRFITGLYGHTGANKPSLPQLVKEAWKLLSMVRALASYVTD